MLTLTSDAALALDVTVLADMVSEAPFHYIPTDGELTALDWLGDRYDISNTLLDCLEESSRFLPETPTAINIDPLEVGESLAADGVDRVPCLDESTALARIIWAIGPQNN